MASDRRGCRAARAGSGCVTIPVILDGRGTPKNRWVDGRLGNISFHFVGTAHPKMAISTILDLDRVWDVGYFEWAQPERDHLVGFLSWLRGGYYEVTRFVGIGGQSSLG